MYTCICTSRKRRCACDVCNHSVSSVCTTCMYILLLLLPLLLYLQITKRRLNFREARAPSLRLFLQLEGELCRDLSNLPILHQQPSILNLLSLSEHLVAPISPFILLLYNVVISLISLNICCQLLLNKLYLYIEINKQKRRVC